jgi:hypothetical protein
MLPTLVVLFGLGPAGCEQAESRLDRVVAALPVSGRAGASATLLADFKAGRITFEAALVRAETMLSAADPAGSVFAGAVLDLAGGIEDQLPDGPEFELFWRRVGQLAFGSALEAWNAGRLDEAATLVAAGPSRWQRGSYWQAYPNHDILLALTMAQQGRAREAHARLAGRALSTPEIEQALQQIREIERAQLRERLRQGLPPTGGG